MKNAIRCALCLMMGATSLATYASDGYERTASGHEVAAVAAQPGDAVIETSMAADEGHGSGEPMVANADTSSDARSSEKAAIDQLNRERLNAETWGATP